MKTTRYALYSPGSPAKTVANCNETIPPSPMSLPPLDILQFGALPVVSFRRAHPGSLVMPTVSMPQVFSN